MRTNTETSRPVHRTVARPARKLQRDPSPGELEPPAAPFSAMRDRLALMAMLAVLTALAAAISGLPWGWVLGVGAVLIAVAGAFPRIAALAWPVAAYVFVWIGFNLLRARADGTPWADWRLGFVANLEAALFGGALPSGVLQARYFGLPPAWYDYVWTAVYLTFFFLPHLVAMVLLWRNRRLYWRYVLATGVLFAFTLVFFYALPTAPPWLITEVVPARDFAPIQRVASAVAWSLDLPVALYNRGLRGSVLISEVKIEPNPMAAMPSIHFATTVLLVLLAWRVGRLLTAAAIAYAVLMGIALVYLGEHYVLDLLIGGILVTIGWLAAGRFLDGFSGRSAPRPLDVRDG